MTDDDQTDWTERRNRLVAQVSERVRRCQADRDPAAVLDPEASEEVDRLVWLLRGRQDPEAAYWMGMLSFWRFAHLPFGVDAMREMRIAALQLLPLTVTHPGAVPDVVREHVEQVGASAADWNDFAVGLLEQYFGTGDPVYLDCAIDNLFFTAVERSGMPDEGEYRRNLLMALHTRYRLSPGPEDLRLLVVTGRKAVALTPRDEPRRGTVLAITADALTDTAERTHDLAVLDEAVELFDEAVATVSASDSNRWAALTGLSKACHLRYEISGQAAALQWAVEAGRAAVEAAPDDGSRRSAALGTLSLALLRLAEHTGCQADLDEAVMVLRRALREAPGNSAERIGLLTNLAAALMTDFERRADPAALEEAITLRRQAVASAPPGQELYATVRTNLAVDLLAQDHYRGPAPELVEEAVGLAREAAGLLERGSPPWLAAQGALAHILRAWFRYTPRPEVLEESLALHREVLAALSPDSPRRTSALMQFGYALTARYESTGDSGALIEAMNVTREALGLTPPGHADRAHRMATLAGILADIAQRADTAEPLVEAVGLYRQAAELTPERHAERASTLESLAGALRMLFQRTGDAAALDESIGLYRQAVALVRDTGHTQDAYLGSYRNNLAVALRLRSERTGDPADFDEAVALLRQAAAAVPEGRRARASRLSNLAFALRRKADVHGDDAARAEAREAYREAALTAASPPLDRVEDARHFGALLAADGLWAEAHNAFAFAVGLLPMVAPRSLARQDQEYGLSRNMGLAADAAACALTMGDPLGALRILEQGRGVLFAQTIDGSGDLAALREQYPDLAAEFARLTAELRDSHAYEDTAAGPTGATAAARGSREVTGAWDDLLGRIRTLPGFGNFLGSPDAGALLQAAVEGPIVVVNVSAYRSDALLVTPNGVDALPLPRLTPQAVDEQVKRLDQAVADGTAPGADERAAQRTVHDVLGWLWDTVTEPVLDRLENLGLLSTGTDDRDGGAPPRIWWSPTGQLTFLPLHAAGHHDGAGEDGARPRTVLDRVASSYTPTIRALVHARGRTAAPPAEDGLLVVAMPRTPGARPLPGAHREVECLSAQRPTVLSGAAATSAAVRAAMARHRSVHFACHAVSEAADPSLSRLLLHDHADNPLTVQDISRMDLSGSRLAFLSACDTARNAVRLADEAIHITSAFQLAGFPEVIGTLWPVNDAFAAHLAAGFYGSAEPAAHGAAYPSHAALALHRSLRAARDAYRAAPSLWAAYMHTGA
ncbi:CHAT domain-containing protein [Streptomyces sp. NPDC051104]|uniref:CHAT domain-containing tetratricopeptide repeat protein n=1 Tax=Streptomyces sp. NPDC051104 TaxID=3155044 RepID=UPI00342AA1EE